MHNKKRNTLFLYETLIRELTKSILEEKISRKNVILLLLKEYFKKGTTLHKELECYKELLSTNELSRPVAERLLQETKKFHSKIDKSTLFSEQTSLIKRINEILGTEVYDNFLPNYRSMATIYQIFNKSSKLSPKKRVFLEENLISILMDRKEVVESENSIQPINKLAFKTFVNKFNSVYSGNLLKEQKELLSKFSLSSINDVEFRVFLNDEVGRLKNVVKSSLLLEDVKNDSEMVEKTHKVVELLESFSKKPHDNQMIEQLLRIQSLAKEITSND